MKSLAFLPLALIVSLPSGSVLALPTRTVFAEQAQGLSGSGINLEVPPGYGLTINFIETGEVVKQAWIGDPSRFVFSSNGNLCPQGLQDSNCTNTGATVIFLRQIKPVQFPGLVSSSDGGTQLTLITEGADGGQKQYSFGLSAISRGKPKYTTLIVKPNSQKTAPLPIIPSRHPAAPPSMLDKLPLITSSVQRQQTTFIQNNSSNIGTTTQQRPPLLPKKQSEQPPSIPIPVPPPLSSRENTTEINQIPEPPKRPVRTPTQLRTPTITNRSPNSTPQRVATPTRHSSFRRISPQQSKVAARSLPPATKPQDGAAKPRVSQVSATRARTRHSLIAINSSKVRAREHLQQRIDDANAIAFGLRTANENGQIKNNTRMYRKAQTAIVLLRQGKTREEAARRAEISLPTLIQLIKWGQERP